MSSPADLEALMRRHQTGVWRYLRFLGCKSDEASDLTQETFLRVIEHPFEERSDRESAAWLRNSARFLYLKALRSGRQRAEGDSGMIERLHAADAVWDRYARDDEGERYRAALDHCLGALDQRSRATLDFRYRDGASIPDIGAAIGLAETGTKSVLARAKAQLRECIERKMAKE